MNDVFVENGRYFQPSDSQVVLLESHFADTYKLKPGDQLAPIIDGKALKLNAVGVVASPEYLIVSASRQDALPSAHTFAVLVTMILAALPAIRRVNHLDLAEATKVLT